MYDLKRQRFLEAQEYTVFRVFNDDVLDDLESVALGIAKAAGVDVGEWLGEDRKSNKK